MDGDKTLLPFLLSEFRLWVLWVILTVTLSAQLNQNNQSKALLPKQEVNPVNCRTVVLRYPIAKVLKKGGFSQMRAEGIDLF